MTVQPTTLAISEGELVIQWSDGKELRYTVADLRNACPCAACNTERERSGDSSYEPAAEGVCIQQMSPVGNYAYNVRFSDGHDTGIFTLDLLRELGRSEE